MKYFRVVPIFLLLICLPTIFATQKAVAFNLPKPLKYNGLIFLQPMPEGISTKYLSINQGPYQTIEFNPKTEKAPKTLVLPSISQAPISQVSEVVISESVAEETPTPTLSPTPTPKPTVPTSTPVSSGSNSSNGGLNADILFSMSNDYRASHGLPAFQKDERICSLAAQRAPEIGAEISEGHMHSGKNSHNFPYWFGENIITMNSEAAAFNWWVNDPIHHDAIVGNYTHSCVACSGNACTQEFTSFQAK